ncbi:MAG: thioredoxin domain-containing protein [Planctomycetes bacterium]|nr:thioredoxin domain-containing protein [Planctomycetota bacterium]
MTEHKHTNRLVRETSPYLLQHAHNPVDWYAWGPDALEAAKKADKPIFLSIGYSACHWCHVMERESFENEETAALMNRHFINVKVDREERPDLDEIYMGAVQLLTGRGGWPMSVFLLPDLRPFFGGTYFPPRDGMGMPGFPTVLEQIARAFKARRLELGQSAEKIVEAVRDMCAIQGEPGAVDASLLDRACEGLVKGFDREHGGFGHAPKFPPSMELNLLLRRHRRGRDARYLEVVETTLDRMARGGMYDQVGGGFCRYSTDERWLVPHFEKMLYDNSLLARTYLAAWQATGKPFYARVARETLDYVLRDMSRAGGGFFSAEDADSEGVEGKFYVWEPAEVLSLLGDEDGRLFCEFYDITREGNFEEKNIPNVPTPIEEFARARKLDAETLVARLDAGRAKLLTARARRVRPGLDDKLLTSWNALMVRSMAAGWQILGDRRYLDAAIATSRFLLDTLLKDGRLLVTWRAGQAKLNAYLDDYAFLLAALLDLYESTFDRVWLDEALRLNRTVLERFWDAKEGGFFFTSDDHETLLARTKAPYDGVIPSGNSEMAMNLLRLSLLTGDADLRERAGRILSLFHESMASSPRGFANMLCALDFFLGPTTEVALAGPAGSAEVEGFLRAIHGRYLPNRVLALTDPGDPGAADLERTVPLLAGKRLADGKPAAYVCTASTCSLPVTSVEKLAEQLEAGGGGE